MKSPQSGGHFRAGGGPPGRGGPPRDPHGETVTKYWPDYLKGGYFDEAGNLRLEYVCRDKVEPLVRKMCEPREGLTSHQVRRYFGHCRALETRLRGLDEEARAARWKQVHAEVKKLDIAAADGVAKQPRKIPELFHDFIRRNVAAIKTDKDFLSGFVPHFEALVGFGQAYFRKDRG